MKFQKITKNMSFTFMFATTRQVWENRNVAEKALFQFIGETLLSNQLKWDKLEELLGAYSQAQVYLLLRVYSHTPNDPIMNLTLKVTRCNANIGNIKYERFTFQKAVMAIADFMPEWKKQSILAKLQAKQSEVLKIL